MSTDRPRTATERQVAALGPAPQPAPIEGEPKPPTTTERQVEALRGTRASTAERMRSRLRQRSS